LGFEKGRRRFLVRSLSGAVILPWWLSSCARGEPVLHVGSHVWLGYEPMFLARHKGWLSPERVRLVELPSATDSLQALHAGRVEAAALTLDEVLTAKAEGLALTVVMVFNFSAGADVVMSRPDITDIAQLAGKRVVVENSAVGALMLVETLARGDLTPGDIDLIYATHDQHARLWATNDIDAVVTFEPAATQIENSGGRRLFDSRQIPGRIVDVLAVRPETVARNPKAIQHLIDAHFTAVQYLVEYPQDASFRMAPRLGIAPVDVLAAYRGITLPNRADNRVLLGEPDGLRQSAEELMRVMLEHRLLPAPVELNNLFDTRFLNGSQRGRG